MNYYGRFYRSKCIQVLHHLNEAEAHGAAEVKRLKVENVRRCMDGAHRAAGPQPVCPVAARRATGGRP